ncbi:MAG: hypothetical protein ACK5P7_10845 [Bdellovibrio sp.]|jgi:hypothetical protein
MKQLNPGLFFFILALSWSATAQMNELIQSVHDRETKIDIRSPPFYMMTFFEIKSTYQDTREEYLKALPEKLKKLKLNKLNENSSLKMASLNFTEMAQSKREWEQLMTQVYTACADAKSNSDICQELADLRLNVGHSHRRQTIEDREIEAFDHSTKKQKTKTKTN